MIWVYVLIYATDKLLVIVICYADTLASVFMTVPSSQLATTTLAEYSSFSGHHHEVCLLHNNETVRRTLRPNVKTVTIILNMRASESCHSAETAWSPTGPLTTSGVMSVMFRFSR